MSILKYPLNLSDSADRVQILGFDPTTGENQWIHLYCPNNLQVGDGASYGNFDLGVLGDGVGEALLTQDSKALENTLRTKFGSGSSMDAAVLSKSFSNFGLGSSTVDRARDMYLYDQKRAINPNTVLQYTNSELRSFSFEFKMVATSSDEAKAIKKIVDSFRINMYAEKENLTLKYPWLWVIMFYSNGAPNPYLPMIYECYLSTMNTVYNASGNMTHYDGAPTEVSCQLTFRESKALSRDEIRTLSGV